MSLNKEVVSEKTRVSRVKKEEIGRKSKGSLERQVKGRSGILRCMETEARGMPRTASV